MSEALTFKTKKHLLHALIDGKLGESFGAQLISHACIRMMTGSKDMVEKLLRPQTHEGHEPRGVTSTDQGSKRGIVFPFCP